MRTIQTLVLLLLSGIIAFGQTNRGGISGTVTDPTGAVIPGAMVTVINTGTNQSQKLTTSADGAYAVTSLEPVIYRITVEAPGFKKTVVDSIKVDTASTATVNVALVTGGVENTVNVIAEAPLLNTESGTTSQTITERQIQDAPLFNRSVLDLAVTIPNVSGDAGSENPAVTSNVPVPGFNLSLNGGRPGSTAILADGVNNTGVGIARAVVSFSPETVQEFTVSTSAYSAEYGQTGGGVINATTKSGTNQYHGTALWYQRNPALNARSWTTSTVRPPNNLRENQFHASLGGPLWLPKKIFGPAGYDGHDKSFFFFAVEPRYRQDFLVVDTLMPTDAMRGGDFSGLVRVANGWIPASVATQFPAIAVTDANPTIYQQFTLSGNQLKPIILATGQTYQAFPGNKIPQSLLDPVALKGIEFLPHAQNYFINSGGQLANFLVTRFVKQNEKRYQTRIDHTISNNNRLNFRFTWVPAIGVKGFGSDINGNGATYSSSRQAVITDTHTFTPTLTNEVRINYTRGKFSDDFSPEFSIKGGRNLSTELGLPSLTAGGLPLFNTNADGINAFASIGAGGSTNNFNVEERYNVSDIVYWNHGNMSWKFGADLTHARLNVIPFFGASGGRWDFRVLNTSNNRSTTTAAGGNVFASYLLGVPNSILTRPVLIPYYYRWNSGAAFVQNDWKIRPNLTLNLGLRYSLQYPRKEKYNQQGVFRPDLAQTFNFATPVTVNGKTFTSALVPAFAYSGRDGRSEYIFPVEYKNFEPRFGFAYSPQWFNWMKDRHLVIRGGYGLSHVPITGNNRLPNPDFGATTTASTIAPTATTASSGAVDPTSVLRLSSNPPLLNKSLTPATALNIPADGLVYLNSLAVPGFVVSSNTRIPYVQNWNLTFSYEIAKNTVIEAAYVGSKGTHLFLPLINLNPRDFNFINGLESAGGTTNSDTTITDPLGRKDLSGGTIAIPLGTLATQYLGFNHLYSYYNSSANSIRHATYVSLNRRINRGLTLTGNYTFGKSIDDASDASPDKNVLTTGVIQGGHVTFGAPRSIDRSISAFDIKHTVTSTVIYDLPFGRHGHFLTQTWKPVNAVIGDWSLSGIYRLRTSFPFLPVISDANRLSGDLTHTVRPDIVSGAPLKNPLWTPDCKIGALCEPYINPAAFIRPVKGQLGNAPRTLDIRGPWQRFVDISIQKNFSLGGDGKRRLQFRVDLLNAFNHPNFAITSGTLNSANDFMGLPAEYTAESGVQQPLTTSEYNAWATFNNQPLAATPAGAAQLKAVRDLVNVYKISGSATSAALPVDFFHVQLPQGFATKNANAFDITSLNGFKLYRLRNAYGNSFGVLRELNQPRYIQFGIKINF